MSIKFQNKKHKDFYYQKLSQVDYPDSYNRSLIYLLAMNQDTRKHFNQIFNINENTININSLKKAWQTSTSLNVCRLAFNLFNGCANDNPQAKSMNKKYSIYNLFCTSGAGYFFEAIKLRYPEYTRETKNDLENYIDEMEEN